LFFQLLQVTLQVTQNDFVARCLARGDLEERGIRHRIAKPALVDLFQILQRHQWIGCIHLAAPR
jgi:hypothetical protein